MAKMLFCFKTQELKYQNLTCLKTKMWYSVKEMYTNNEAQSTCLKDGLWLWMGKPEYFPVPLEWYWHQPLCVFFAVSGHRVHVDLPGRPPARPPPHCLVDIPDSVSSLMSWASLWTAGPSATWSPAPHCCPPSTSCACVCVYIYCVCVSGCEHQYAHMFSTWEAPH